MDEAIIKAYAMLTAHEFAIEVLLASALADMPGDIAARFASEFHERSQELWSRQSPQDFDEANHAIARQVAPLLHNLFEKAEKRSGEIRLARAAI